MPSSIGTLSFSELASKIKALSVASPEEAEAQFPGSPNFAKYIAQLFLEDRLFDILPRLETQLQIVRRFFPPVRPALDPYTSTQIGIFSKRFDDYEIGRFLGYPECCMRSFAENVRYGIDEGHVQELKGSGMKAFATTAGFIPCSIFCREAQNRGLLSFIEPNEIGNLRALEKETAMRLPHFHPEYREHYFEVRLL
ncbi:MAG: DUF483 domain-containing protein [Candidatus Methanosuratincola sp.]|jgi:hypothetical protein|nr:DUF483 domain-containing protein [Candidatus Methanosuratincola sp.]